MGLSMLPASHSGEPCHAGEMSNQESPCWAKESAKSYTWGRTIPCTSTGWGLTSSQRKTPNWSQATNVPLQQRQAPASWSVWGRALPARWRRWSFPSAQPPETQLERWVQFWAPQWKTDMGIQWRATKMIKWLEYLTDKERDWDDWDCLTWRREGSAMFLPTSVNAWCGRV